MCGVEAASIGAQEKGVVDAKWPVRQKFIQGGAVNAVLVIKSHMTMITSRILKSGCFTDSSKTDLPLFGPLSHAA